LRSLSRIRLLLLCRITSSLVSTTNILSPWLTGYILTPWFPCMTKAGFSLLVYILIFITKSRHSSAS
jgi:hypothetical protein